MLLLFGWCAVAGNVRLYKQGSRSATDNGTTEAGLMKGGFNWPLPFVSMLVLWPDISRKDVTQLLKCIHIHTGMQGDTRPPGKVWGSVSYTGTMGIELKTFWSEVNLSTYMPLKYTWVSPFFVSFKKRWQQVGGFLFNRCFWDSF